MEQISMRRKFQAAIFLSLLISIGLQSCHPYGAQEKTYVIKESIDGSDFYMKFYITSSRSVVATYKRSPEPHIVAMRILEGRDHSSVTNPIFEPYKSDEIDWKKTANVRSINVQSLVRSMTTKLGCDTVIPGQIRKRRHVRNDSSRRSSKSADGKCVKDEYFDKSGKRYVLEIYRTDVPGGIVDVVET